MTVMVKVDRGEYTLEQKIGILLLYWSIIMPILTGLPFVPSVLKYGADVLLIALVLCSIKKGRLSIRRNTKPLFILVVLLFGYAILLHSLQFQSAFYFLWGCRNLFRFYIAFFAYANLMRWESIEKWFACVDIIFWINVALSIIQFVFLGVRQDNLGGVFGISGGVNGYTIPLLCIVVVRHICLAFDLRESIWKCIMVCVASLLVAAMAELKFFFVVFVFSLVVAAVLSKFSFKKVALLIIAVLAAFACAQVLVYWFGFKEFLTIEGIVEIATRVSYSNSSANDVNRLSAISTLNRVILKSPLQRVCGLGLGNCDVSNFAIFNTPFGVRYSYLHYTWFAAPMVYLEMGYVGLTLYILFFVICFCLSYRAFRQKRGNRLYCQMAIIMSISCCMLAFYNASLRYEVAYIIYFVLALPFIRQSAEENNQKRPMMQKSEGGGCK